MSVAIVRSVPALRAVIARWKAAGERVAVVPTMGALHAGHLSLVRAAVASGDRVIVTVFVNPRQFDNAADLAAYPGSEAGDAAMLAPLGIDLIYAPGADQMYPPGFATSVAVDGLSEILCGAFRSGHFDGVATVVTKLMIQTAADRAYFGQKDYQQLLIVSRLVADLDLPVEIVGCPTVREPDGLALSSRNARLGAAERAVAPALAAALIAGARAIAEGMPAADAIARARAEVLAAGFDRVEYLELRRDADLAPATDAGVPARLLAAAWLGGVRLIDNVALPRAGA